MTDTTRVTIAAMRKRMAEGARVKAYGKHFAEVRVMAGFASHLTLAQRLGGDDDKRRKYFRSWLLDVERGEKLPRRSTMKMVAEVLGVPFEQLDPTPYKLGMVNEPVSAKVKPAKVIVAKPKSTALPVGGKLSGIEIREVDGGTLVRFEALLPPGRDDLLHSLLLAAAAAKAS